MTQLRNAVFGRAQVRLDPWQPEFGAEFNALDAISDESSETVDTEMERTRSDWGPIDAPTAAPTREQCVWFVDGVRRLEARVTTKLDGQYSYGGFGAFAVGAVELNGEHAAFRRYVTGRVFASGSAEQPDRDITIATGHVYIPLRVSDSDPDGPTRAIHGQMRQSEEMLAREIAGQDHRLVVVDGPLTFEESTKGSAVGYIKRIVKPYLTGTQLELLASLQPGQRTPLFGLQASKRFSRISWFLRLVALRKGDSEFSGIVRLEVAAAVGIDKALDLAGQCCVLLPRLRGRRALDKRAPQNLLPISALETFLRRKLGDERVARRRIESFIAREAA